MISLLTTGLLAMSFPAAANTAPDYVAHEWGTFTSVQGSDGEPLHWNPFVNTDLPEFVLTRERPFPMTAEETSRLALQKMLMKNTSHWLQRMETPVIYFHAREDFNVDVAVDFPKGLLTEWYPAASSLGPVNGLQPALKDTKRSHLAWENLQVLGHSRNVTRVPQADAPSHYFTARTAGASPVRVQRTPHPSQAGQEEQFLFYRGAGNFTTPLHVRPDGDRLLLENRGEAPLGRLFIYRHRDGRAVFQELPRLKGNSQTSLPLNAGEPGSQLAERLTHALTEAGLLAEEAEAMVNTWRNDWLGDRGLRVLYLLPQSWTDETLPLKFDPVPRQVVRVMVGRAEVIEPDIEQTLEIALQRHLQHAEPADTARLRSGLETRFHEPAIFATIRRQIKAAGQLPYSEDEMKARQAAIHVAGMKLMEQFRAAPSEPARAAAIRVAQTTAPHEQRLTMAQHDEEEVAVYSCAPQPPSGESPHPTAP